MKNRLEKIRGIERDFDGSFYFYDEAIIDRQIQILLGKLRGFEILYSIKTNPFQPIVNYIGANGLGADAASFREVEIAERAGIGYENIFYSTPGKKRRDIESSLDRAIIIADSYNELSLIDEIAGERGIRLKLGLRINLNYDMDGGPGSSSKFGVDETSLEKNQEFFQSLKNIQISGIHVHLRSQLLDYKKLYNYYKKIFELALFCKEELGWNMDFINFGGGLGIVYSEANDRPLDMESLGLEMEDLLVEYKDKLDSRLLIESGRFLVAEAGLYVSPILDIKESMGKKYLIVEKALNGFLRPSIGELLLDYSEEANLARGSEPLYTKVDAYDFIIPQGDEERLEKVSIVGSLCTGTDRMATDIMLPRAKPGDLLIVTKAGSYSYSLSPLLFASHDLPGQFYMDRQGLIYK